MKKVPFFPVIGCLSGVMSVASGIVVAAGVRSTVASVSNPVVNNYANDYANDFYSYFFGGAAQTPTIDENLIMTARIVEILGKSFGLLLIMFGLWMVCYFGYKIEKSMRADTIQQQPVVPCPPYAPEYGAPEQMNPCEQEYYAQPAGNEGFPPQDGIIPDENLQN